MFDIWNQNPLMLIISPNQAGWCWILHAALLPISVRLYRVNPWQLHSRGPFYLWINFNSTVDK